MSGHNEVKYHLLQYQGFLISMIISMIYEVRLSTYGALPLGEVNENLRPAMKLKHLLN